MSAEHTSTGTQTSQRNTREPAHTAKVSAPNPIALILLCVVLAALAIAFIPVLMWTADVLNILIILFTGNQSYAVMRWVFGLLYVWRTTRIARWVWINRKMDGPGSRFRIALLALILFCVLLLTIFFTQIKPL
jgi:hypothetical protein